MSDRPPCKHCGQKPAIRPRGLCWHCFEDLAIRALYPSRSDLRCPVCYGRLPSSPSQRHTCVDPVEVVELPTAAFNWRDEVPEPEPPPEPPPEPEPGLLIARAVFDRDERDGRWERGVGVHGGSKSRRTVERAVVLRRRGHNMED